MAQTSGTYASLQQDNQNIIDEAAERAGIDPSIIVGQKLIGAIRTLNLTIQSWINRGCNLWTIQKKFIGLNVNQSAYSLPIGTSSIQEMNLRRSRRNLGGTPFSSEGGDAANAFDNNPNTACTQTAPNGYISYDWTPAQFGIQMVGIQSNVTINYTIACEYSFDNVTWLTAMDIPIQSYPQSVPQWFSVPVPIPAVAFRVRETGGSTLDIQELYFNSMVQDTVMTAQGRDIYMSYSQKYQQGTPSIYYLDRQINPIVYIWPVPQSVQQFQTIFFNYTQEMQDIGSMTNVAQVPTRFNEALTAALAHKFSIKYSKETGTDLATIQYLKSLADEEYLIAFKEDSQRVQLGVTGDFTQGWTQT